MVKIGLKSRSRRVVQDSSVAAAKNKEIDADENGGRCCWENLPGELLREVLSKLEGSESNWPERKHVVACAGVCKSWRETMKDLVQTPELSGKITFPVSVKQPGPRGSFLRCFVKRNRACQSYHLFVSLSQALASDGKCILVATKRRRATCTDYLISLQVDGMSKGNNTYIGKLRSNFLATKFVVYDALPPIPEVKITKSWSTHSVDSKQISTTPRTGNYPVAHISYELNMLGARGPRRMNCVMDSISTSTMKPNGVAPTQTYLPISRVKSSLTIPFFRTKSTHLSGPLSNQGEIDNNDSPLVLRNKAPHWHEQLQCWCLNFHGRVTVASVKNFQLVASSETGVSGPEHGDVILQFGKVGKDVFTMDYKYPISAFQAFAICLSSFDTKIACE